MKKSKWIVVAMLEAITVLGGCAAKVQQTGFLSTYENLQPVNDSETFLRYVAPNEELKQYSSFILDPIAVQLYDPDKAKDIKPQDIEHLQQFFYAQLSNDLQGAGFKLATTPGPGVARLRVAITNLKKSTPALNVLPQTKMTGLGLGQATAEAEIVDSQTGKQLAAAVQSETGSRLSFSGLAEWGDVEAVMKEWSKKLAGRLSAARDEVKPA